MIHSAPLRVTVRAVPDAGGHGINAPVDEHAEPRLRATIASAGRASRRIPAATSQGGMLSGVGEKDGAGSFGSCRQGTSKFAASGGRANEEQCGICFIVNAG